MMLEFFIIVTLLGFQEIMTVKRKNIFYNFYFMIQFPVYILFFILSEYFRNITTFTWFVVITTFILILIDIALTTKHTKEETV